MPTASLDLGGAGLFPAPRRRVALHAVFARRHRARRSDNSRRAQPADRQLRCRPDLRARRPARAASAALTLEPRLLYLNVPFRDQDDLPLFDTGTAGPQPGAALPHQPLRRRGSRERCEPGERRRHEPPVRCRQTAPSFWPPRSGQIYYFEQPRVRLPDEPRREQQQLRLRRPARAHRLQELERGLRPAVESRRVPAASAPRPTCSTSRPASRSSTSATASSGTASSRPSSPPPGPSGSSWNVFARYVYSLRDDKALERFAGLEYRSCCWRLRLLGRKFVSSRTGEQDTGIYLQLELTGLASVGSAADAFLAGAIRGYSRDRTQPLI